ncbi:MAG TPA: DinB family protein [Dehalococcoidia bacterium]
MSTDAAALIERLRAARAETVRRVGAMDPERLGSPSAWRGAMLPLGHQVGWLAEGDETRRVAVEHSAAWLAHPPTYAQRALLIGSASFGRLLGSFVGVAPELFERQPAPGEWGLREALAHVIAVAKRYLAGVEYAVARRRHGDTGPLRPPADSMPPSSGETERQGTLEEMLARFVATHDEIVRRVGAVADVDLDAPGDWASLPIDVRFRIHRFAAHQREHTAHIGKIQQQIGWQQNEPQMLLAGAQAARATFETVLRYAAEALLEQPVAPGGVTITGLVQQALDDEAHLQAALA